MNFIHVPWSLRLTVSKFTTSLCQWSKSRSKLIPLFEAS